MSNIYYDNNESIINSESIIDEQVLSNENSIDENINYINDDETFIPCEFCDESVRFNEYEEHIQICSQPRHRLSFHTDINELIVNPRLLMSSQFMINNSNIPLNTTIQPISNFLNIFNTILNESINTSNLTNQINIPQPLISETTLESEEINENEEENEENEQNEQNEQNEENINGGNTSFFMFNRSQERNEMSRNLISPYILSLITTRLNPQRLSNEPLIPIRNPLMTYPLNISDYDLNNLFIDLMGGNVEIGVSNIKDVITFDNNSSNEYADTDVCPICRETFSSLINENINICSTKKCNHKYCEKCINTWLSKNKKCPVCMCELE